MKADERKMKSTHNQAPYRITSRRTSGALRNLPESAEEVVMRPEMFMLVFSSADGTSFFGRSLIYLRGIPVYRLPAAYETNRLKIKAFYSSGNFSNFPESHWLFRLPAGHDGVRCIGEHSQRNFWHYSFFINFLYKI